MVALLSFTVLLKEAVVAVGVAETAVIVGAAGGTTGAATVTLNNRNVAAGPAVGTAVVGTIRISSIFWKFAFELKSTL